MDQSQDAKVMKCPGTLIRTPPHPLGKRVGERLAYQPID